MGANTEPIRYKKPVMSSMGNSMAAAVPTAVTATAVHFPLIRALSDSAEMPADQASRKVVVTVDKTRITSAARPRPALTMMTAISLSPV